MNNDKDSLEAIELAIQLVLEVRHRAPNPNIAWAAFGIALGVLCEVLQEGFSFDDEYYYKLDSLHKVGVIQAQALIKNGTRLQKQMDKAGVS